MRITRLPGKFSSCIHMVELPLLYFKECLEDHLISGRQKGSAFEGHSVKKEKELCRFEQLDLDVFPHIKYKKLI